MCPIKGRNEAFQGIASEKRFRLDITELLLTSVKHTNWGKEKKLTGLILLLFSFIFLFLNIKQGFCAVRMLVPSSVLSLPPGAYAVLVDKASQHLFLLLYDKGRLKVVKKVICATGEKEGDKKKAGDKRTPVGIYFCKGLLLPPRLGAQYGICALPLNYPNLIDRRHQRDGSGIWIHGIHENRPVKSTQGCVVLQNGDLAFLARHIHLYTTPVVIAEKVLFLPEETLKEHAERALEFLERWRNAWASGDIEAYIACYAPNFLSKGMNLSQWHDYKLSLFRRYHHKMLVQVEAPVVIHTDAYDVVSFKQVFRGGNFRAVGYKRLYLQRKGKERKIIGEEWIPLSVVEKNWTTFRRGLAFLKPPRGNYRIVSIASAEAANRSPRNPYKEVREFITNWKASWEKRDIKHFASFYSKHFRHGSMDFKQWKRYKVHTFMKNGPIRIVLRGMKIQIDGDKVVARFYQIYQSRVFRDRGLKELVLSQESGGWKILRERWFRSR